MTVTDDEILTLELYVALIEIFSQPSDGRPEHNPPIEEAANPEFEFAADEHSAV